MSDTHNSAPIPILMYHSICVPPQDEVMRSIHVKPRSFATQMWILHKLGYTGLSMTDLEPYLRGEKTGKVVGITFDDGYKNNLIHAAPALKKYGFTATCYVVSSALGKNNFWDSNLGIPSNPIMTQEELFKWIAYGLEIGCHTANHKNLSSLHFEEQIEEIQECKSVLENLIEAKIDHFCYPYGKYTDETIKATEMSMFTTATTMMRGRAFAPNDNLLELPRVPITFHTLPHLFAIKLLTSYEDNRR